MRPPLTRPGRVAVCRQRRSGSGRRGARKGGDIRGGTRRSRIPGYLISKSRVSATQRQRGCTRRARRPRVCVTWPGMCGSGAATGTVLMSATTRRTPRGRARGKAASCAAALGTATPGAAAALSAAGAGQTAASTTSVFVLRRRLNSLLLYYFTSSWGLGAKPLVA